MLVAALGLAAAAGLEAQTPTVAEKVREVEAVAARGPFAPAWTSLEKFQTPDWYQDAKFGIFIHWGLYSVPAFGNEWYPRNMYKKGEKAFEHHVEDLRARSPASATRTSSRCFKAEKFDAAAWAALFKAAGAKYVVPVAEHHDGFPMYASDFTEWSAARMGPRRDVIGELAKAVRAEGLTFGVSSHRVEHWWFFDQGKTFDSDVRDPTYAAFYGPAVDQKTSEAGTTPPSQAFLDDWLARTAELVDKYQPQLSGSTGGSRSRPSTRTSSDSPRSTTTAARSGAKASPSTTRSTAASRSPTRPACSTSSAGSWPPSARSSGRPTRPSRRPRGATSRTTTTRRSTPSSTISSTSSARTAACCSTSGPGPTAPSPRSSSRCSARSGSGWVATARPSTARGPGRSSAKGRRRWSKGRLPTRSGRRSPPRTSGSRARARRSTRSRWHGPIPVF